MNNYEYEQYLKDRADYWQTVNGSPCDSETYIKHYNTFKSNSRKYENKKNKKNKNKKYYTKKNDNNNIIPLINILIFYKILDATNHRW